METWEGGMSLAPARPRRVTLAALSLASLLAATLAPAPATAGGPRLELPDLRMAKPRDVRVLRENGRRRLRFTTVIVNEGRGPIDVIGKRDCRSVARCPTMRVRQRIRRSDGSWRTIATRARMRYEVGDHHTHWHVVGFEEYRLYRLGVESSTPVLGKKFGFCFFDIARVRPFGPPSRRYHERYCGTPRSLRVHVGLSEGWRDTYPWDFEGQFIDVTGLRKGEYLLCVVADPRKRFRQANTRNDQTWVRLRLGSGGVIVRDSSRGSCSYERKRWLPAPRPRPTASPTPTPTPTPSPTPDPG